MPDFPWLIERAVGLAVMVKSAGGDVTVTVTGIVIGLLVTPKEATLICPV